MGRSRQAFLTLSPGGLLLLQDDPLSIQTRYGGAKVQGLLFSTLKVDRVH